MIFRDKEEKLTVGFQPARRHTSELDVQMAEFVWVSLVWSQLWSCSVCCDLANTRWRSRVFTDELNMRSVEDPKVQKNFFRVHQTNKK